MKHFLILLFFFLTLAQGSCADTSAHRHIDSSQIRITCIGASITEGARIENPRENSFPGQLQSLLGSKYKVFNYGIGGTTMLKKGNYPYWNTSAYQEALKSNPDIVFIDLGGNDAKAVNRPFYDELENDAREMIRSFKELPSKPRVIVMLPTVFFETDTNGIYDPASRNEVTPRLREAAYKENVEVLDMYTLLVDRPDLIPDKIHPEEKGSEIMAKRLFQQVICPFEDAFNIFDALDKKEIDYQTNNFFGYECAEFQQYGRDCKIVKPKKTRKDRPWIWRARFWAHEPQTDIALLERGYHLVYCDQAERMANAQNINEWNNFYKLLNEGGLSKKTVLEGMSRGAVYSLNWAAANPDKVAAVYVDNPLLDIKAMYYGPNGEEKPENEITIGIKENRGIDRSQIKNFNESPIDKIDEIVKGNYPILILCAELDKAAVNSQNAFPFEKKIKEKGGAITVIEKKGFGHHPHSFPNPAVIVDFIENAVNPNTFLSSKKYDSYKGLALAGYQGWFSCPGDEQLVLDDIDKICNEYDIRERNNNSSYLFHNEKPLVAVWGVGFNDNRRYGFKEAELIIDALKERGFSVLLGVPTNWRKLEGDTMSDPQLHSLVRKCDIVMPWFVGRYNEKSFSRYESLVKEDMKWCKENNVDYAPLAFPGFSWKNMRANSVPIDRNRGSFYWKQLSYYIENGCEMIYLAMFDEIDEGTAIFKCATEVPVGESYFLPLDADLGSDYYLFLAGQATKMLRKEIPFSKNIPNRHAK